MALVHIKKNYLLSASNIRVITQIYSCSPQHACKKNLGPLTRKIVTRVVVGRQCSTLLKSKEG